LRIDLEALQAGRLAVDFTWPLGDRAISLRATFPDSYPRLRPIVNLQTAAAEYPERHVSPLDGNVCLLGRDTGQWPENWTLVDLLTSKLQDALNDTGQQDPQGEPAEFWWNLIALKNSYCLIDSGWGLGGATSGRLTLRFGFDPKDSNPFAIRAIVTEVRGADGAVLASWTSKVLKDIVPENEMVVPWIYRDETILPVNPQNKINELVAMFTRKPRPSELSGSVSGRIFVVIHKTELGPSQTGMGWIFILESGHPRVFKAPKPGKRVTAPNLSIIPTFRAGSTDIGARVPATGLLNGKKNRNCGSGGNWRTACGRFGEKWLHDT